MLSYEDCKNYSLTGVMARSVGLKRDLRLAKVDTYSGYNLINLKSYCGINGDCYDRYLIRMLEMGESLNICNYITTNLLTKYTSVVDYNSTNLVTNKLFNDKNTNPYTSMEDLITHFID